MKTPPLTLLLCIGAWLLPAPFQNGAARAQQAVEAPAGAAMPAMAARQEPRPDSESTLTIEDLLVPWLGPDTRREKG